MTATATDPLIGQLVDGRYAVRSRIARGGMATVYLATDRRLDRDVALKVMHPHLVDGALGASFVSRFRREAKSAARLTHPGLVAVYDQGVDGDTSYLTMEYVDGTNLRHRLLAEGSLSVGESLDVLHTLLDALAAAHRQGLVHRDIKPENVLCASDGRIKVADFGLARAVTEVTVTTTGTILGTVAYLAPELISEGAYDTRTDVYAAGVLLYEMVTGRQPYVGETPIQVAFQHVNSTVPAPSLAVPGLPDAIDELVAALTACRPQDRPADADAALGLLRSARAALEPADLALRAPDAGEGPDGDPGDEDGPVPASSSAVAGGPAEDEPGADDPAAETGHEPTVAVTMGGGSTIALPLEAARAEIEAARQDDPAAAPARRGTRRRVLVWVLGCLLALGAVAGVAAWWLTHGPGAYTSVPPSLVGSTEEDARQLLSAVGLDSRVERVFDDDIPPDEVISTDPSGGESVRKDGTVTLLVSRGVEMLTVPEGLVGAPEDEARQALSTAGFTLADPHGAYHDTVPAGQVLEVSVPEGSQQRHDVIVSLVVSQGPAPVTIPQVAGLARETAEALLTGWGLQVTATEASSETVPAGHVVSQTPEQGQEGHRGDNVALVVSTGPPLVAVPDVTRRSTAEATRLLQEAGLKVKEQRYVGGLLDTVRFQDVEAGKEIPKGSTVTITIW